MSFRRRGCVALAILLGASLSLRAAVFTWQDGSVVVDGSVTAPDGAAGKLVGGASVQVAFGGTLGLRNAGNLDTGAAVLVSRDTTIQSVAPLYGTLLLLQDYCPAVDGASSGVLSLGCNSGPIINARLAEANSPLGNGKMFLGGLAGLFTGPSLAALVAGDPSRTYRLGGGWAGLTLDNSATVAGAMADLGGQSYNVQIGTGAFPVDSPVSGQSGTQMIVSRDAQTFTGLLTVNAFACYWGQVHADGVSPLGSAGGDIVLHDDDHASGYSLRLSNKVGTPQTVSKSQLIFDGAACVGVDSDGGAGWMTLSLESLTRSHRGVLGVAGVRGYLNDKERLLVASEPDRANGMVAPYLWNPRDKEFLDYESTTGFKRASFDATTLTGATATMKVNLGAAATVPAQGQGVYALKSAYAVNGGKLTVASGGVIFTGSGITHKASFDFGQAEGIVYVTPERQAWFFEANAIQGCVYGSGGLTKCGRGTLWLQGDNSTTLSGDIVVNQGFLMVGANSALGAGGVILNGGGLVQRTANATGGNIISKDIVLGPLGGTLGGAASDANAHFTGNISGEGALRMDLESTTTWIDGATNTYSGGTYIAGATGVVVAATSCLGSGPVVVGPGGLNGHARLVLEGSANISSTATLALSSSTSEVRFESASPAIGSMEGSGTVYLGADGVSTSLTVGGDGRDCDFFGVIADAATGSGGSLTKIGGGNLALWGDCTFGGPTVVNGGALAVQGSLAGPLTLNAGSVDGQGRIGGSVTVCGGAFGGSVAVDGDVTIQNGSFTGSHAIGGSLTLSAATVSPGHSAGTISVAGGLSLSGDSTLDFDLSSPAAIGEGVNDLIEVSSGLTLAGMLNVSALPGFGSGTYRLIDYGGALSGPGLQVNTAPRGRWDFLIDTSTPGQVNLVVSPVTLPGDVNGDGEVNSSDIDAVFAAFPVRSGTYRAAMDLDGDGIVAAADVDFVLRDCLHGQYGDSNLDGRVDFIDFQQLLDHWQYGEMDWHQSDFSGDGMVDFADFQTMLDNWNPTGYIEGASVPEPGSLTLLLLCAAVIKRRRASRE